MSVWALSLLAVAMTASPQHGPPGSAPPQDRPEIAVPLEDVVVEGRRSPVNIETAEAFVEQMSVRPHGALTLGRWEAPVCLEILNLEGEKPAMILWRVRARAAQVGAPVAEGDCKPNVSVVMTADGPVTATDFVGFSPRAFRSSAGRVQRSREELGWFRDSDAPVRWWHVSSLYDTNRRVFIGGTRARPAVVNTDGEVYFNQNRRQAFLSALVIVDVSRRGAIAQNTLADYLAFVILAEVDPQSANLGFPSILKVWEDRAGVRALTSWDIGYLRGLYAADVRISGSGRAVETGYQEAEIARSVLASVHKEAAAE